MAVLAWLHLELLSALLPAVSYAGTLTAGMLIALRRASPLRPPLEGERKSGDHPGLPPVPPPTLSAVITRERGGKRLSVQTQMKVLDVRSVHAPSTLATSFHRGGG